MKVSRNAKLAAALMAFAFGACGDDDDKKSARFSAKKMLEAACTVGTDGAYTDCSRSEPSSYWQTDGSKTWNDNAQVFTVVNGTDRSTWDVYDADGNKIEDRNIQLTQGVPVTLEYKNDFDVGSNTKHYLTAPIFFSKVAWRKAETKSAEYKAETFNAFETLDNDNDESIKLYFVPMESGTFDGYCERSVTGGSDYKGIKAGTTTPDLTTGHAGGAPWNGEGPNNDMVLTFTVAADHDVSLAALATRNADYNGNLKGSDSGDNTVSIGETEYAGDCFWGKCDTGNAPQVLPWVKAEEPSDSEFVFKSYTVDTDATDPAHDHDAPASWVASGSGSDMNATTGITMHAGYAHILKFESASGNTEKHYFTAPELYAASVFRKAMDVDAEIKADYFKAVEVLPEMWTSLFMVPMEAGSYDVTCTEGDHASMGMVSKVTVVDTAP